MYCATLSVIKLMNLWALGYLAAQQITSADGGTAVHIPNTVALRSQQTIEIASCDSQDVDNIYLAYRSVPIKQLA